MLPGGGSASTWKAITKSDSSANNFASGVVGIYVGVAGDMVIVGEDNVAVTFKACPVGILWVKARRVNSTSTTATDMVALFE